MKILIAEDEPVSRRLLGVTLAKWGYEVMACCNGAEALGRMEREAPKMAILDWMMPEMDGIDVCRTIRERSPLRSTYVLLLTAKNHKEDIIEGLDAGADDYLIKPFDREELHARIKVGVRVVEMQEKLIEAEKTRVLTETAAAAAHEINQPLTVVIGICQMRLAEMSPQDSNRGEVTTILEAGKRISKTVQKMDDIRQYVTRPYIKEKDIVDFDAASKEPQT